MVTAAVLILVAVIGVGIAQAGGSQSDNPATGFGHRGTLEVVNAPEEDMDQEPIFVANAPEEDMDREPIFVANAPEEDMTQQPVFVTIVPVENRELAGAMGTGSLPSGSD